MKSKRGREGEDIKAEEAQADVTARIPVIVEAETVSRQKENEEVTTRKTLQSHCYILTVTVILMPKAHLCSF